MSKAEVLISLSAVNFYHYYYGEQPEEITYRALD